MVRLKHRYLLVEFLYPGTESENPKRLLKTADETPPIIQFHQPTSDKLSQGLLVKVIRDGVAELYGDYGAGSIGGSLAVKYLSTATSTAIIRVSRAHFRMVWAALTFMTRLPHPINEPCIIQVVRVSGTIRKSEEELVRRARRAMLKVQGEASGGGGAGGEALLKNLAVGSGARGGIRLAGFEADDDEDEDDNDAMDED